MRRPPPVTIDGHRGAPRRDARHDGDLAYEAQQAARSHRATAENVLRDYASFAAWELTRLGRQQVLNVVEQDLTPGGRPSLATA